MTDSCETFKGYRITTPLSSLEVSNLYTIACGFHGPPMSKIGYVNYAHFPKSGHICEFMNM